MCAVCLARSHLLFISIQDMTRHFKYAHMHSLWLNSWCRTVQVQAADLVHGWQVEHHLLDICQVWQTMPVCAMSTSRSLEPLCFHLQSPLCSYIDSEAQNVHWLTDRTHVVTSSISRNTGQRAKLKGKLRLINSIGYHYNQQTLWKAKFKVTTWSTEL